MQQKTKPNKKFGLPNFYNSIKSKTKLNKMANYSYVVMENIGTYFVAFPYRVFLDDKQALEFVEKHNEWYKELCKGEGMEYDWQMELWIEEIELINK